MEENATARAMLERARGELQAYEATLAMCQQRGGELVRELRGGMTQHQFAQLAQINQSHLSRLENGKVPLTRWMVERLIALAL